MCKTLKESCRILEVLNLHVCISRDISFERFTTILKLIDFDRRELCEVIEDSTSNYLPIFELHVLKVSRFRLPYTHSSQMITISRLCKDM